MFTRYKLIRKRKWLSRQRFIGARNGFVSRIWVGFFR
jgi:hypothetical protein